MYNRRWKWSSVNYAIPEEDTIYVDETGIEFIGTRTYYIFEHGNIQQVNLGEESKIKR